MNKKLMAFAVAAAFAAPMVANADSGNVVIYGKIEGSYDYVNTDAAGQDKLNKVSSNSSYVGFKGAEDLGNGLSAVWQVENGVNIDNGAAGAWNSRNTYIGLSSKAAGTLLLGNHDTPYKLGTNKLNVFGDSMGNYTSIIGASSGVAAGNAAAGGRDLRLPNVVAYITPTFSGFHAAIATSMMNEGGNMGSDNTKAWSMMAMYDNGPLFASLGHERVDNAGAAFTTDLRGTKLGVGYKIAGAQVGFIYEKLSHNNAVSTLDRNAMMLTGSYAMGSVVLKGAYGLAKDSDVAGADDGAKQYSLGADYNFSKRTAAYALYSKMNNDTNGRYILGGVRAGGAYTPTAGDQDASVLSLGMRHSF
jgi:predicted porin